MKKLLFILSISLALNKAQAQQEATLLYNWQDTSLVGSFAYNNTYNECWGIEVNNRQFAIIGSTAGTHFFDVTEPQNSTQVAFLAGAYTGGGLYTEITMILLVTYILFVMKVAQVLYKLLILLDYQIQ